VLSFVRFLFSIKGQEYGGIIHGGIKTVGENGSTKYYTNDAAQAMVTSKLDRKHCTLWKVLQLQYVSVYVGMM